MAPKKKAKTAAPPMACFAGAKITVIGANPFQRKLWEAKVGAGAAFLKPSQAASLKEGNDFVVIAAENVDPATVRAKAGAAQLVGEKWLTDSIARNERQSAAANAWGGALEDPAPPPPPDESDTSNAPETKGLVVVAVGLPGAGKSRFHKEYLAGRDVVRCCQDVIGRSRCLALVEETVRAGGMAYVDRCDGYPEQRAPWVEIAKRCNVEVVALRFTADASTCIQRAKARAAQGEHDSKLKSDFARVILKHRSEAEPIGEDEGFDRVYAASEDDDAYNAALVDELLGRAPTAPDTQRLDAAVPGTTDAPAESDAAPSLPDTTDAIRAFALAPAEQCPRDVPGYDSDEPRHAKIVDNVITAGDAARLIELAKGARDPYTGEQGYRWADLNGEMRRDHRKSDRVIIDAPPELARELFARLRSGLPETTTDAKGARWRLAGLNPYLRVLRYRPGDFFLGHPDGCFSPSANRRSFMTVLLYLNEGYRGGFTTIYDTAGRALPVAPRTGMALVHHHRVWHEVPMLREGVKHVIRTDVMYERVFE